MPDSDSGFGACGGSRIRMLDSEARFGSRIRQPDSEHMADANVDQEMAKLGAKGVKFEDYAMGDQGPNTVNGIARDPNAGAAAWFVDSEGNTLNLVELPPGMDMNNPTG